MLMIKRASFRNFLVLDLLKHARVCARQPLRILLDLTARHAVLLHRCRARCASPDARVQLLVNFLLRAYSVQHRTRVSVNSSLKQIWAANRQRLFLLQRPFFSTLVQLLFDVHRFVLVLHLTDGLRLSVEMNLHAKNVVVLRGVNVAHLLRYYSSSCVWNCVRNPSVFELWLNVVFWDHREVVLGSALRSRAVLFVGLDVMNDWRWVLKVLSADLKHRRSRGTCWSAVAVRRL